MTYLESWEEFEQAAERLYLQDPMKCRFTHHYDHAGSLLKMKMTDNAVCLQFKTEQAEDYEPGVLTQLVEFSYRYVTKVLEDAKVYSGHARKRAIDIEDIRLAVQVLTEQTVTTPPTREILLELAQTKNDVPMPLPRSGAGLRLPPDRHCLTSTNYRLTASRGGTGQAASGGVRMVNGSSGSGASAVPTFQIQPMAPPPGAGSMPGGLAPTGLNNPPAKRKWDE